MVWCAWQHLIQNTCINAIMYIWTVFKPGVPTVLVMISTNKNSNIHVQILTTRLRDFSKQFFLYTSSATSCVYPVLNLLGDESFEVESFPEFTFSVFSSKGLGLCAYVLKKFWARSFLTIMIELGNLNDLIWNVINVLL